MKKLIFYLSFTFLLICSNSVFSDIKVTIGKNSNGEYVIISDTKEIAIPKQLQTEDVVVSNLIKNPDIIIEHNYVCNLERDGLIKYRKVCNWKEYKYLSNENKIVKIADQNSEDPSENDWFLSILLIAIIVLVVYLLFLSFLWKKNLLNIVEFFGERNWFNIIIFFIFLLLILPFGAALLHESYRLYTVTYILLLLVISIFRYEIRHRYGNSKGELIWLLILNSITLVFVTIAFVFTI